MNLAAELAAPCVLHCCPPVSCQQLGTRLPWTDWSPFATSQVRLQKSMDNLNQKADVERIRREVLENLRQLSFAPGAHRHRLTGINPQRDKPEADIRRGTTTGFVCKQCASAVLLRQACRRRSDSQGLNFAFATIFEASEVPHSLLCPLSHKAAGSISTCALPP